MTELIVPSTVDAERIAALINRRSFALRGISEESTEGVKEWFSLPTIDPRTDMRLAVSADGEPEGWADVSTRGDEANRVWVDVRVLDGCRQALELLFAWAEARAAERVDPGGRLFYVLEQEERALRASLVRAGYTLGRTSLTMERLLLDDLAEPTWPAGIEARQFSAGEARRLHEAQEEAFAGEWFYDRQSFPQWEAVNLAPASDTSLWLVAWDGGEIAGFSINRPRRGEDETVGWVDSLGVREAWRRHRLGEALLRGSFRLFAGAGKLTAGLGVDAANATGAVRLYERVGMQVVERRETWERLA